MNLEKDSQALAVLGSTSIQLSDYVFMNETTSVDFFQLICAAFIEIIPILASSNTKHGKKNALKGKEIYKNYLIF